MIAFLMGVLVGGIVATIGICWFGAASAGREPPMSERRRHEIWRDDL